MLDVGYYGVCDSVGDGGGGGIGGGISKCCRNI